MKLQPSKVHIFAAIVQQCTDDGHLWELTLVNISAVRRNVMHVIDGARIIASTVYKDL